jgi:predicted nucleic acid-binding protein
LNRSPAFWDSSALTALLVTEPNSVWARRLAGKFIPFVWWSARVEIHSAISRLHRSGGLDGRLKQMAMDRLEAMQRDWYEVEPSDHVREQASILLDRFPLRAADSLQLAAALIWCRNRPAGRHFICADERLSDAAGQAGFNIVKP